MTSGQKNLPLAPSKYEFTKHKNNADGVWVRQIAGTPNSGITSYMSFIDNSGEESTPTINEAGRSYFKF